MCWIERHVSAATAPVRISGWSQRLWALRQRGWTQQLWWADLLAHLFRVVDGGQCSFRRAGGATAGPYQGDPRSATALADRDPGSVRRPVGRIRNWAGAALRWCSSMDHSHGVWLIVIGGDQLCPSCHWAMGARQLPARPFSPMSVRAPSDPPLSWAGTGRLMPGLGWVYSIWTFCRMEDRNRPPQPVFIAWCLVIPRDQYLPIALTGARILSRFASGGHSRTDPQQASPLGVSTAGDPA